MLKLYKPSLNELSFRQELLSDEATMAYNHAYGGCIDFPKEKWESWKNKWLESNNEKYFYRYLYDTEQKNFVGELAYHYDEEMERFLCDVIVHARYRGQGFGREGLRLLCVAAKENGLSSLYDNIALDNPSLELFLRCGFEEERRNEEFVLLCKRL